MKKNNMKIKEVGFPILEGHGEWGVFPHAMI